MHPVTKFLFTDIDDTLTTNGKLGAEAYSSLWDLQKAGIAIIPVTGRPAGWCEMIARFWPVEGIVGENGGFYFRYAEGKMRRHFFASEKERSANRKKLDKIIAPEILKEVSGSAIASDQFSRLLDLAIDYREDVSPLPKTSVGKIVSVFEKHGAVAKISSIHVNGWFGIYDKLSMCKILMKEEFNQSLDDVNEQCAFVGDSPNDEPMFKYFLNSFGVSNVSKFLNEIKFLPQYIASREGGSGFAEIAKKLIGPK